ncbi:MAG: DUF11 domain-containing protein [Candidatus Eisenbacteria bacterium]|uniref:DUF11 domain-containing protein n=1 Tax=Eiseniibacteriota bacterium TaxID=2212470 RepID=A0A849SJA7_UNCEI|nr:DUF11 domain-containing protein [Candidatus Eisenbacteria bacterium]
MRARLVVAALVFGTIGALVAPPSLVHAQIVRAFGTRFTANTNGDVTLIGNTLMSCNGGGTCTNGRNGTGASLNNNDFTMTYVDVDGDGTTTSSSTATLTLPAGATVLWAGLYWSGNSNAAARNQCRFSTPVAAYATQTATQLDASGTVYQGFREVTALVQAGGNGLYRVANVQSTNNTTNVFAGWGLVVAYGLATDPPRNLVVFDGYAQVAPGATVALTVNGFVTPPAGAVNSRLGVLAGEGDRGFTGDRFQLNSTILSDGANPADNFFNSSVSRLGANVTTKNPNYVNQLGWDVDLISANGVLPNNATSATITLSSVDDRYYPGVVTFATDLYAPVVSGNAFQKRVTDLNGGAAQPGDVLEYTLQLRNLGNDNATQLVARDTLPANSTYVPGSIVVVSGANAGAKSDATGDDQAEYEAASRRVTVRLGSGATAAAGGTLAPTVATSVRFRIRINVPTPSADLVSNQASNSFIAQQIGAALTARSDSDTLTAGDQPAVVTVDAPRIAGTVFEDVNYGGGAGRSLIAAAGVVRPGARVELYDAAGNFAQGAITDAAGLFTFDGWSPGSYQVRVVSSTVLSSRTGAVAGLLPVQTFRTTAAAGTALADVNRVGGESPWLPDAAPNLTAQTLGALTSASATPHSLAPVTLGTADLAGLDFGFNFDTVVHARDVGQGSLAQFLINANALGNGGLAQSGLTAGTEHSLFMVSDGAVHPGLRAGLPNLLSGGVVRIAVVTVLPSITGAFTRIDGATQSANVGNALAGSIGAGGTVGVDGLTLPSLARPEVAIVDSSGQAIGLDVQGTDVTIANLAIYGFGLASGSDASADVRVGAAASRTRISDCAIGATASSFSDPGAAARSAGDHLRVLGADDGVIERCLVGFGAGNGIALNGGSDRWLIDACEIRGNAIGTGARNGVSLESATTTTIRGCAILAHHGAGVDAVGAGGSHTVENCTVDGNGNGITAGTETPGLRMSGNGNRVDRNRLTNNYGAGILVSATASGNTITRNRMSGNGTLTNSGGGAASNQLGIDLLAAADNAAAGTTPYRTRNDLNDADAGANGLLNFPVIHSAVLANGQFTLTGWARPGSTIEVFVAAVDPSGFGEGDSYVGTFVEGSGADLDGSSFVYGPIVNGIDQGSDNTNRFRFTVAVPGGVGPGVRLTATATVASNTSEFSGLVSVTAGVALSGFGYADADHDAQKDASENGSGLTLWAKLISVASPASALDVVSVDAVSGAYAFGFVTSGAWNVVLDDNASATDVSATAPAGRLLTEAPSGSRLVNVATSDVANQNFGLWFGSRASGRVFRDDGTAGGIPNDGVAQPGEPGISSACVRAVHTACPGGQCDSTLSDAAGGFTLWWPASAATPGARIVEVNPVTWLSTGGTGGTSGGTYARATDAITHTPVNGLEVTALGFGDVPPNQLVAPGLGAGVAGSSVAYAHTFTAGSTGSVSFGATQSASPPLPGWGWTLIRDLDCDGVVDPGEPAITSPLALATGQVMCLVLRHATPNGAPAGAAELVTLSASMSYVNAAPILVSEVQTSDRTTVIDAGALRLAKSVDLANARPGDVLTYTITYTNLGPAPLSSIVINDATPAWTTFDSGGCGALGSGLSGCGLTVSPAVGAAGAVRWTLTGALAPGASGSVTFRVRVGA